MPSISNNLLVLPYNEVIEHKKKVVDMIYVTGKERIKLFGIIPTPFFRNYLEDIVEIAQVWDDIHIIYEMPDDSVRLFGYDVQFNPNADNMYFKQKGKNS